MPGRTPVRIPRFVAGLRITCRRGTRREGLNLIRTGGGIYNQSRVAIRERTAPRRGKGSACPGNFGSWSCRSGQDSLRSGRVKRFSGSAGDVLRLGAQSGRRRPLDLVRSVPAGLVGFFASLAAVIWLVSFAYTLCWVGFCHPDRHRSEIDRLFREAQEAYLQGRWLDSRRGSSGSWRWTRPMPMRHTTGESLSFERTAGLAPTFRQCLEWHGAQWRWEIQQALARLGEE